MASPKPVKVEKISESDYSSIYQALRELILSDHEHLKHAKIGLCWNTGWKVDRDGHLVLGKAKKVSDLEKESGVTFDFIIQLHHDTVNNPNWTQEQTRALLDHELSHCDVDLDKEGEQKEDSRGRKCWRLCKHDLEEFRGVVERHGLYKVDLIAFAEALKRAV